MIIRNVVSICLVFLLLACQKNEQVDYQKSPEETLQSLNLDEDVLFGESLTQFISEQQGRYLLIDLREAAEYNTSHREGAVDIPLPQLLNEENKALLGSKEYILLSGEDFTQSAGAHVLLKRLGYEKVKIVTKDSIIPETARFDYAAVFTKVKKQHAEELEAGKPKPTLLPAPKKTITPKPKPQKKAVVEEEEGC